MRSFYVNCSGKAWALGPIGGVSWGWHLDLPFTGGSLTLDFPPLWSECLDLLRWNKIIYFKKSGSVPGIDKLSKVWAMTYISIDHSVHFLIQLFSVVKLCLTLYHNTDCSTPGLPVLHCLSDFVQTHVHWVRDAIQPSQLLLLPSPPALNLFQHQGPFQWIISSHQVARVLEHQLQHQSFQWTFRTHFL